ncbi:MAG: hypothetical protein H3C34_27330 [Caldilineaceae bacterium]|nr:hypothetical protein [Caldilineaceae bacterium]
MSLGTWVEDTGSRYTTDSVGAASGALPGQPLDVAIGPPVSQLFLPLVAGE